MKKILFAADGKHFSEGAFEFVRRLNSLVPINLAGTFLPQMNLARYWNYVAAAQTGTYMPQVEEDELNEVEESIARFKALCIESNIAFEVNNCFEQEAIPVIESESRFADALVIGSQVFYENDGGGLPNTYLKEVLYYAECPVLLIPEKFFFPDSLVFCYDGSESSVFSIRQFAYLFPELTDKPVSVLYLGDKDGGPVPNQQALMELVGRYFKNCKFLSLAESLSHAIHWLSEFEKPMVIAGAYGRSSLSRMFSRSFMTALIREHATPIFITHK